MLIHLFITFFIIGFVSFGGGYAMIPLIQEEVLNQRRWMEAGQLADIVAVAGMSPGPIATNIAVLVGFRTAGWAGAVIASLAIMLPALLMILAAGKLLFRVQDNKLVRSSFYGLRPVVAGMILYAAYVFAAHSGMFAKLSWFTWSQIAVFAGSLAALLIMRKHPFSVILLSGLVGIALYG